MFDYRNFQQVFGQPRDCQRGSTEEVQRFEQLLPPMIIEHWKEVGICSYGDGLLRFTHPDQFVDILPDWVDPMPESACVFLRTAFADLYFWDEGYVYALDVHHGRVSQVTSDVEMFFNDTLCDETVQERALRRGIYRDAFERLGPPAGDECYAFVPALGLGGNETAESLQRVKLREHLEILRQAALE